MRQILGEFDGAVDALRRILGEFGRIASSYEVAMAWLPPGDLNK